MRKLNNSKITKITSLANNQIKYFTSLNTKKIRQQEKKFLVEGFHLCEEAAKRGLLTDVLICEETDLIEGVNNFLVTYDIIKKVTKTVSPQKIVGIVKMTNDFSYDYDHYLLFDDVNDPGNLGTIIRSAVAFGVKGIIMGPNTVDIYNDKVIRATQGAIFDIGFCYENLENAIGILKSKKIEVFGTSLYNSVNLNDVSIPDKWAIILGNESRGVSKDLLAQTDVNIIIPISDKIESLNVSVSAGILLYEFQKWK